MNDVLKWGLILGGAWFLYEEFFAAPAAATSTTSTNSSTTTTSAAPTCPPPVPPMITCDSAATQQTKVLAAASAGGNGSNPSLNASEWNYYYNQVYAPGQSPGPTWSLNDDGSPMSVSAYVALRQSLGFSGYVGLGAVIPVPRVALVKNPPAGFKCPAGAMCATRNGVVLIGVPRVGNGVTNYQRA